MNPYAGLDFWGFFPVFFYRLYQFFVRSIGVEQLVIDEIQIFSLVLLSISCSLLGSFLLLRRSLMMATALSHTVLLGIVSAFLLLRFLQWDPALIYDSLYLLFFASFVSAIVSFLLEEVFSSVFLLQKDASIALVFNVLFALGVVFVTLFTKNVHLGTEVIHGNIDGIGLFDLRVLAMITIMNVVFVLVFYPGLKITSFDPILAKSMGCNLLFYRWMLFFFTSLTIMSAFRCVGIVLVLGFLSMPYLIANVCTKQLYKILLTGPLFAFTASLLGTAFARHILSFYSLALSTGAIVVLVLFLQYALVLSLRKEVMVPSSEATK